MYDDGYDDDDGEQQGGGPRLKAGRYRARAFEWGLADASNGNKQVAVCFALLDEDYKGETITWYGSFSKNLGKGTKTPLQRTLETLRTCGWQSDDLSDLTGLDANEVSLVIEHEEYEGRMQAKVKWVNRAAGLALKAPLTPEAAKAFAARMKGDVLALAKKTGAAPSATSRRNANADHPNAPGSTYGREPGSDDDADVPY